MPGANSDAEEHCQLYDAAIGCYRAALGDLAHYAIELEENITGEFRRALSRLAGEAETVNCEAAPNLLCDYRDQAAAYVNRLCEELTITARSLQRILDSLAEVDGDYEGRMGDALARLRAAARSPEAGEIEGPLLAASTAIQEGLEGIRQRHEATVSQLLAEIRTLHKRIDKLESAAALDLLTALLTRSEMEKRIESLPTRVSRLVLLSLTGLRLAETRYDGQVRAQLAAAFLKRLSRILPPGTVIGRWSEEEFMAILPAPQEPANRTQDALNEQLSGVYACVRDGKAVRPALQVRATLLNANQVFETSRVLAERSTTQPTAADVAAMALTDFPKSACPEKPCDETA